MPSPAGLKEGKNNLLLPYYTEVDLEVINKNDEDQTQYKVKETNKKQVIGEEEEEDDSL